MKLTSQTVPLAITGGQATSVLTSTRTIEARPRFFSFTKIPQSWPLTHTFPPFSLSVTQAKRALAFPVSPVVCLAQAALAVPSPQVTFSAAALAFPATTLALFPETQITREPETLRVAPQAQ